MARDRAGGLLIQAALNGTRTRAEHPAVPLTTSELARDAAACVAAGAGAIHLHPRDETGRERLDAAIVDAVVVAVREACGVPVGVTTGEWIEPDLARRLALLREWREPDYTSVNLSEPGALEVIAALLDIGIGVEAGVSDRADAELLGRSGLGHRLTRILIEPVDIDSDAAVKFVDDVHRALDAHGLTVPRLQHGEGETAWVLLADAIRRGLDTRIGLEDTLHDPNGEVTAGNAALVRAAAQMRAAAR